MSEAQVAGPSERRYRVGVRAAAAVLTVLVVAACAQTRSFVHDTVKGETGESDIASGRVLLMPMDVELYVLTAGGLTEPHAEWTALARTHLIDALTAELREKRAELVLYHEPARDPAKRKDHDALVKLHGAVGQTILVHKYNSQFALPTKEGRFDWTLGDGAADLARDYDADYALFVFVRDSYSSAGRVMLIFAAALLGVNVPGGVQLGFASLVDLDTGDIVWFNRLVSEFGDLRAADTARGVAQNLLDGLPL